MFNGCHNMCSVISGPAPECSGQFYSQHPLCLYCESCISWSQRNCAASIKRIRKKKASSAQFASHKPLHHKGRFSGAVKGRIHQNSLVLLQNRQFLLPTHPITPSNSSTPVNHLIRGRGGVPDGHWTIRFLGLFLLLPWDPFHPEKRHSGERGVSTRAGDDEGDRLMVLGKKVWTRLRESPHLSSD